MDDLLVDRLVIGGEANLYDGEAEKTVCVDMETHQNYTYTYINKSQAADIIDHLKRVFELGE